MAAGACPAAEQLHIETRHDDSRERAAVAELQEVVRRYDVDRWTYTRHIFIDRDAIPHSHPVLTLDTGKPGDPQVQLASFLHEQFHWYLESRPQNTDEAIAAFRKLFHDPPDGKGMAARNDESTYLHLIVCDLEFQAMTRLVGESRARELLAGWRHYTWIYRQVLDNPEIRRVNARYGLLLP